MVKKIKFLPYIFHILYFNFKYLPFKQAIYLPIFLYKPRLLKTKGKVIINTVNIKPGMIRLGEYIVSLYPNSGIVWENHGGTVIFEGKCRIGNDSKLSIGSNGNLTFGNDFLSTAGLKLACYNLIQYRSSVRIGWDCLFMDTDFHKIKTIEGKESKGYGTIDIGASNWFGNGTTVFKNTCTPDYTIIAAKIILNKKYNFPSYSLIGGSPVQLLKSGVYRDVEDDSIVYE